MWFPTLLYGILCSLYNTTPPLHVICGLLALSTHFHTKGERIQKEEKGYPVCPSQEEQMSACVCVSVGVWFYMVGESFFGAPMGYFLLSTSTFVDYIHTWEPDENEDPEDDEDPPSGSSSRYT